MCDGGIQFLVNISQAGFTYSQATSVCMQHNATLPRYAPASIGCFHDKFYPVANYLMQPLHIWRKNCASSGICRIWILHTDQNILPEFSQSNQNASRGFAAVVCEKGKAIRTIVFPSSYVHDISQGPTWVMSSDTRPNGPAVRAYVQVWSCPGVGPIKENHPLHTYSPSPRFGSTFCQQNSSNPRPRGQ